MRLFPATKRSHRKLAAASSNLTAENSNFLGELFRTSKFFEHQQKLSLRCFSLFIQCCDFKEPGRKQSYQFCFLVLICYEFLNGTKDRQCNSRAARGFRKHSADSDQSQNKVRIFVYFSHLLLNGRN